MPGRENHRERLLRGALECLRDKGYAHTTARDIAAAAHANLGSIGYHFGSKEALLNAAIGASFEEWTQRITAVALTEPDLPPVGRLMAGWRAMIDDFDSARPYFVAFLEALAQAERSPELRAQLAAHYDELRRDVGDAVAAVIGGEDADVLASFMIAVGDGLLIQSFLDAARAPGADALEGALGRGLAAALAQ